MNNIPLHGHTTVYLSIHQSMDIWVVSAFSFYECKHSCKFLCECLFSFLLDIYLLGVELLGHMLILCANTLVTWCKELTHWKRSWCWERLKAGGERNYRGWDDWMASLTGWTWVWASSGSWWWTGRPGVLQSMVAKSQTRLSDWTELMLILFNLLKNCLMIFQSGCIRLNSFQ